MAGQTAREVIALTGGMASGKSAVARILEKHGADLIDADLLAREALTPGSAGYLQVVKTFPTVLTDKNEVDRKKLGAIVFGSVAERKKLEDIVHPIVNQLYKQRLNELQKKKTTAPIVYVVPLFFESRFKYPEVNKIVVVSASREICIARIMKRDALSRIESEKRFDSQTPLTDKEKMADLVIYNDKDLDQLAHNPAIQQLLSWQQ